MTKDGQLTLAECLALQAWSMMPGHEVFLQIIERELENLRIELQNTDPADREHVLSRQSIVHAAQKFWKQVGDSVRDAILVTAQTEGPTLTKEQRQQLSDAALLDATRYGPPPRTAPEKTPIRITEAN